MSLVRPTPPRSSDHAGGPVDLEGRVALVTGASAGLGRHFAQTLATAGATVVVVGRRLDRLESLAETITAAGGTCTPIPFDVTDVDRFGWLLDTVQAAHGVVDTLVNNAGIPDGVRAHQMDADLVQRVISVNLTAPFLLSIEVVKRLIAAERPGHIVNLSSMLGFDYAGQGASLYSVTKAAMNRATEVLALEWARYGINVNAIAPGSFRSEMMDGMIERVGDPSESYRRKRLGLPSQLDSTLLYLLSPASEFVTGTVVRVDDGQYSR